MPTHEGLGPDDREDLQDRRKPAIKENKEPAIIVREPDATRQPTPQDIQLMSKHRVLSLKPQLRLEWRGQDGQYETEQPDHSASLGDSITSSTPIRFSVHTRGQDGQNETEQPDHSASLGDSITASTRIRFSVHTTAFSASSLRFDLNGEASTARTNQISAIIAPV